MKSEEDVGIKAENFLDGKRSRTPKSRIYKGGILFDELPDVLIGPGPAPLPRDFIGPGRNPVLDWQPSRFYKRYLESAYGRKRPSRRTDRQRYEMGLGV